MKMLRASVVLAVAALATGCSRELWGLPRIAMSATSPDGKWVAFARNHPTLDGPDQSIWFGDVKGRAVQLRKLGADTEAISAIVWSADSRFVAYLTNDAILGVYEAATQDRIASGYLRYPNVNYPPKYMVRELAFSADGESVTYLPCERTFERVPDSERWTEHTTCSAARESRVIADLARQQAMVHPGRAF